jgi:hypothetical protein
MSVYYAAFPPRIETHFLHPVGEINTTNNKIRNIILSVLFVYETR